VFPLNLEVAEEDDVKRLANALGFDVHQLRVGKHEVEERDEPLQPPMLPSS